jgi:hypothetical protein
MNAAPARSDHRQHERLCDVEKAVDGDINDPFPLLLAHSGKRGVIVNSGVVHQNLYRAVGEHRLKSCACRRAIGDVKGNCPGISARPGDFSHQSLRGSYAAIRLRIYKMTVERQSPADCGTDRAAAAGDKCAPGNGRHGAGRAAAARVSAAASSATVARPLKKVRSALWTEN